MKKEMIILTLAILIPYIIAAQISPERTWYYNDNGQKTTVKERWDEDSEGNKNGTYILYFSNGTKQVSGTYIHGQKSGTWKENWVNGFGVVNGELIYNFKNNKLNGEYKAINNSKNITAIGSYTNGYKSGYWKEEGEYIDGIMIYQEGNYITTDSAYLRGFYSDVRDGKWINSLYTGHSVSTKKGCSVIYSKGVITASYDENGVDFAEKERQEQAAKNKAVQEAHRIREEENAYIEPLINKWNTLPDMMTYEAKYNKKTFKYVTKNNKISEIIILIPFGSNVTASTFKFNKEGWLELYENRYMRSDGIYTIDKLEFDKNGKLISSNCSYDKDMFK